MSNQVILALDGSTKDKRALAVAAAIAEITGATLHLVRVIEAPSERLAAQSEALGLEARMLTGRTEVERELARMAARIAIVVKHQVTWVALEGNDVAHELVRYAAECDALIVAMATRALGAVGRVLRGSVADHVLRECASPVLLVPPGTDYMAGKQLQFTRVLVPLDGSALAARALDYVLRLPRAAELEYALVEVVARTSDRPAALTRLDEAARRVRAAGARIVECDVGVSAKPAPVILDAVREALVDIVAMSSRGAGGLRRLILGSVAEGVVRACEVPVLLLTPACLDRSARQGGA